MRLDDIDTLVAAGRSTARQMQAVLDELFEALQTSGATRLLSGVDICHTQLATSSVGVFSIYESRLQSGFGWGNPFDEVMKRVNAAGHCHEAKQFDNYRLAINVLKHGTGKSHNKLLDRHDQLEFEVQKVFGDLNQEGDVCPPSDLVVVSVQFLERCCDLVEQTWKVVKFTAPNRSAIR